MNTFCKSLYWVILLGLSFVCVFIKIKLLGAGVHMWVTALIGAATGLGVWPYLAIYEPYINRLYPKH